MAKFRSLCVAGVIALSGAMATAMQAQTVSRNFNSQPLKSVLHEIERQTKMSVIVNDINLNKRVTAKFNKTPLRDVLNQVLDESCEYEIADRIITIHPSRKAKQETQQQGKKKMQTFKGCIKDDAGQPIVGASVTVVGQKNCATVTDIDGNYTIEIKGASKATLVYSYVGCVTQKHVVKAQTNTLNITLASDSKMMDEVVVVAYGVRKKGTIAGSVSAVKSGKIENVPAASFDQALQGQSTGLQVISSSGEPSKAATFQIRGTNSINSGKSPLFILDGVPISSSDFNTLSPNDIESISVLKDASSTSIYGARAANGVVVITSKRGLSMDKAKITLRAQYGFSELAQTNWKMMNTDERIQFEKEVGLDTGKDYNLLSRVNVNWLDEVFNDRAPLQSYELSINRATDRLNYYVSGGFYDQDGIAQNSTFRRYNIRTNADVKASKWLKVGTNTMAAYEEAQQADDGSYTTVTPISACRFMLPYWNPYAKDGSLASLSAGNWAGTSENPIVYMGLNPIKNKKIDSCAYCAFQAICRYDSRIPGFSERSFNGDNKEDVLDKMRTQIAAAEHKACYGDNNIKP